ncbi:MAG: hypothetical protein HZC36_00785 [Armatimonadetes bacterium]|nr:hypothetical protein [Armatimonadota bacterium]
MRSLRYDPAMRLAIVSCDPLPEPDVDEEMTVAALSRAGFEVQVVPWQSDVNWSQFDMALLRSCWDYPWNETAFRHWLDAVEGQTRIWNPPSVVRWNLNKRYLHDLEAKGVPTVTTWIGRDLAEVPWNRYVVKPTVSCGSYLTRVFSQDEREDAERFVDQLSRTHEPMFQPFLGSVETEGECSVVWIDGAITHAIRKKPRFSGDEESVSSAIKPTQEEAELALRAIQAAPGPLLYARADLMRDNEDKLCVSELELIEPSLFFLQEPRALQRFVTGIERMA